ncbi:DUF4241 domain-containing protein [Streptomyces sp. NPDC048191]|uniref:DUF4241 domain-containing protein n=1 Tax=Streptomyces sp. NPDC048191 TaxID=3155484 RepID=UPI0033D13EBA
MRAGREIADVAYGEGREHDHGVPVVDDPATGTDLIAHRSGRGDGTYPVWIGRVADGGVACFVADLLILRGASRGAGPP